MSSHQGTNYIYQGGLALGSLEFHRNGSSGASWLEAPSNFNGGSSLGGACADIDGDGDPDILLVNEDGASNNLWINALGVPDVHPPTFASWTDQADKADGSPTVIHARVLDNSAHYVIDMYGVDLLYSLDGGQETCVKMASMAGQMFRGVIPGGLDGGIVYRVRTSDRGGNSASTPTRSYQQTSSGPLLWENLGCGTPGLGGKLPYLALSGTQLTGELVTVQLADARADRIALLWISLAPNIVNVAGGTLFAHPADAALIFNTGDAGSLHIEAPWLAGPVGTGHWWQVIVSDPASPHGITLSNGVHGVQP